MYFLSHANILLLKEIDIALYTIVCLTIKKLTMIWQKPLIVNISYSLKSIDVYVCVFYLMEGRNI